MATPPTTSGWSYSEFARLPSDDGNRYEVIEGELYVTPSPRSLHQAAVTALTGTLGAFVEEHGLGWVLAGPIDVLFAEGDYLAPDLVFVRRERRGIISDRGLEGAPDLVVEVLSESTAGRDRVLKRRRYAHFGVPEYWVADPDAKLIEVYRLGRGAEAPEVCREELRWRPVVDGPELVLTVPDVLRGFE
ncbi:MAG TPA: Uma2 family endonuclease [Longimicrobiales bacterium]|nr:Uma2 family endonuclease [Longimicrobiales bacterium]